MIDPAKLKVTELRTELQIRGLNTKGVKIVLQERLQEYIDEHGEEIAGLLILFFNLSIKSG